LSSSLSLRSTDFISELDREANIARNRAILEELELKQAVADLGIPKTKATSAKPVQPSKRAKRERFETDVPRRQSSRLKKEAVDPNESPKERKRREVRLLIGMERCSPVSRQN
jgi:WD repeat-containing protein 76